MAVSRYESIAEDVQHLLDGGFSDAEICRKFEIDYQSTLLRFVKSKGLERFVAFDEYEYKYDNVDAYWVEFGWEEDILSDLVSEAVMNGPVDLTQIKDIPRYEEFKKYVEDKYSTFKGYLEETGNSFLEDEFTINCSKCGANSLDNFYAGNNLFGVRHDCIPCASESSRVWRTANPGNLSRNVYKWRENNPEKARLLILTTQARRLSVEKNLGHDFSIENCTEVFGEHCAITGETAVDYDHFIPLSWGHVGTYDGNMYPLSYRLNRSKWAHNPFRWFEENAERLEMDADKFRRLVETLADMNGVSPEEYRDFVYWCESNKRTSDEVAADPRPSLVIWREQTKG